MEASVRYPARYRARSAGRGVSELSGDASDGTSDEAQRLQRGTVPDGFGVA